MSEAGIETSGDVDELRRECDRLRLEASRLREDLASVLESTSWRLTRPLRRLRSSARPEQVPPPAIAAPAVTAGAAREQPARQRIDTVPRPGEDVPRIGAVRHLETVFAHKVDLVAECSGARSLRDFGGLYRVHGRYLLEPAVRLRADYACMVDGTPVPEFDEAIERAKAHLPSLEVEFVHADFRNPAIYDGLRPVDVSILYEVLLHQENYVQVVGDVLRRTSSYVCFGQPCLREDALTLPNGAVLVQFLDDATKAELREGSAWPDEPTSARYRTDLWMWAQTTSHIVSVFHGFGWELDGGIVYDDVCGRYWEYPLLRFRPSAV